MAKYRFEVVLEYPDDMHPEDILDLAQESIMGDIQSMSLDDLERLPTASSIEEVTTKLKTCLENYGFRNYGTIRGINENRSCTHFLRNKEHISIETAPEEEQDVLEALTDGSEETGLDEGM